MPALPIVTVRWCFLSGRLHEVPDKTGTGFLLQRLLRHGTADFNSSDLARHLDRRGIRLGTQVSVDSAVVSVSALREYLGEAIHIANDVAFKPLLPESALAVERIRALQLHQQATSQVEAMANLWMSHSLYGDHPYGRPVTTRAGLKNASIDDLRALHAQICDPSRSMLIVVGDVEPDEVVDVLARRVSGLKAAPSCAAWSPPPAPTCQPQVLLVERPGAEQVAMGVGALTMPRSHPDFLALRTVNHILGGGASSRLFTELRERQGLTYGVYSQLDCGLWGGDLTASMSVAPDKVGRAIGALSAQMERMGTGDVAPAELDAATDYLVGSFPQRASGLAGVSSLSMAAWLHQLPVSVWRDYQATLQAITMDDVEAAARRWLSPDRLCWVAAGSPEVLDKYLPEFQTLGGPVQRVEMASLVD